MTMVSSRLAKQRVSSRPWFWVIPVGREYQTSRPKSAFSFATLLYLLAFRRRQQIMVESEQRQFQPIPHAQLIKDVGEVALNRFFADAKLLGNVFIGAAFGDQSDHDARAWQRGVLRVPDEHSRRRQHRSAHRGGP